MRLYFAGSEQRTYAAMLRKAGATSILQSAFSLDYRKTPNEFNFKNFVLDSGGYSLRQSGRTMNVYDYAAYCNKHNVKVLFNLDTKDVQETIENQKILDKICRGYVIPVYHYSDFIDANHRGLIDYYLSQGYPFVSVAPVAAPSTQEMHKMLDHVFSKTRDQVYVHGLAVTNDANVERYPFWSVDSTTWMAALQYGVILKFDPMKSKLHRINSLRVQDGSKTKRVVEQHFFNAGRVCEQNIKSYIEFEKHYTKIWEARGVRWCPERLERRTFEFSCKSKLELQNRQSGDARKIKNKPQKKRADNQPDHP